MADETAATAAPAAELPSLGDIKSAFAAAVTGPDDDAPTKAEGKGKARGEDGKFKQAKADEQGAPTKPDAAPEPDEAAEDKPSDDDDKPPTNAERAALRIEKRELKRKEAAYQQREQEQAAQFAAERRVWTAAMRALQEGRPVDMLQMLGINPEMVAQQLAKTAIGEDPQVTALQRKLAQLEARQERERLDAESEQGKRTEAQLKQAWDQRLAATLKGTADPALVAIAEDAELVRATAEIQEEYYSEHGEPMEPKRAARELARRLKSAHTRLGRIFREASADAGDAAEGTDPTKPSVASRPDRLSGSKTRSKSLGASNSSASAKPGGQFKSHAEWKTWAAEMLKNATD